ncbi:MAG: hypothetical protein ACLP0J_09445 [Solirubrobacteraceae bacterium]
MDTTNASIESGAARGGAGTVYLLHFDVPYRHARHYTGWTGRDLPGRLAQHQAGAGALLPLSEVVFVTRS